MSYQILGGVNVEAFAFLKIENPTDLDLKRQTIGYHIKDIYSDFSIDNAANGSVNDAKTQLKLKNLVHDYLRKRVDAKEVERYYICCDARNNNYRVVEHCKFLALHVEWIFPGSQNIETIKFLPLEGL